MDFKDVKKLSCADLNWLKNIENCGKLEVPDYICWNPKCSVQFLMKEHAALMLGRNSHDQSTMVYHITTGKKVALTIAKCNSIIISSQHWGNWN